MTTKDISNFEIDVECSEEELDEDNEYICELWQEIDEECEKLETYATAGSRESHAPLLYPMAIGQRLDGGRYQILHRLGHGGFSTVRMAKDTTAGAKGAEVVALKFIANSHASGTESDDGEMEYQMHKLIQSRKIDKSHLLLCQDTFTLRGPHGSHRVLVLPLAGPGLHTRNVLWQIKPAFHRTLVHNLETMGEPRKISFSTRWKGKDGKAITASGDRVSPAKFPQESLDDNIFLSDFGSTIKAGNSVSKKSRGVQKFVSPERFHGHNPSPGSDMWSFMVVFIYLDTGRYPFNGRLFSETPAHLMMDMVSSLGPLPSEWAEKKLKSFQPKWYTGAGSSEFPEPNKTFQSRLRDDLVEVEKRGAAKGNDGVIAAAEEIELKRRAEPHVLKIIDKVFCFKPQERVKASDLLDDFDWKMLMKICGVDDEGSGK
ncbi:hypothetical protein J7T55_012433 [Diaporthe amygdali]|uniref:uncharacterized protein n=1 Tax=Phomopsis amygdali TaxID=1214568 RepID=UPI0022FEB156|nr:uncharacterized protein J7T55_012433 [Diaporthe amygdali]KAJ0123960.1 hypothetical protein J7T55_012433 [Diaporthe amygdali]